MKNKSAKAQTHLQDKPLPKTSQFGNTKINRNTIIPVLLVFFLPVLLYLQTLTFHFTNFDDDRIIQQNIGFLKDFHNIPRAFSTDAFIQENGVFYRPLQTVSYMVDIQVSGPKSAGMFHFTNVLLFGIISVLIFLLIRSFHIPWKLALFSTLVYVAHPLFVSNIAWIPARGDLLLMLFSLLSFLFFVEFLRSRKTIYLVLNWIAFTIALFSKETAIFLPLLFAICYYAFPPVKRFDKKNLLIFILYALSGLVWFWLRTRAIGLTSNQSQVAGIFSRNEEFGFIPFLKNFQAIPAAIATFFIPFDNAPIPGFSLLKTITGLGIIALMGILFARNKERSFREKIFCFSWFLLLLVPTMLYKHNYIDYLQHRFFLPLVGILLFILFMIPPGWMQGGSLKHSWILIVALLLLSSATVIKSRYYTDPLTFYGSAIQWNPGSCVAYNNRGNLYNDQERYSKAMDDFTRAIRIQPDMAEAYYNRGISFGKCGLYEKAINDFTKTVELNPDYYEAYNNRGINYIYLKMYDKAMADIKTAIRIQPGYDMAYYNYAYAYDDQGIYDQALIYYSKVIGLNPGYTQAYYNRGIIYFNQGLFDKSITDFTKTVELNPAYAEAYFNRGNVYLQQGNLDKACRDFKKAEELGYTAATESIARSCK